MKKARVQTVCCVFIAGTSLMSLLFVLVGIATFSTSYLASYWVETPAKVERVSLHIISTRNKQRIREVNMLQPERPRTRQVYELETVFTYSYGDVEYHSTQQAEQRDCSNSLPLLAKELCTCKESDTPTSCYVNPDNPDEAVIAKPAPKYFALAFGCIFSAVPILTMRQLIRR